MGRRKTKTTSKTLAKLKGAEARTRKASSAAPRTKRKPRKAVTSKAMPKRKARAGARSRKHLLQPTRKVSPGWAGVRANLIKTSRKIKGRAKDNSKKNRKGNSKKPRKDNSKEARKDNTMLTGPPVSRRLNSSSVDLDSLDYDTTGANNGSEED